MPYLRLLRPHHWLKNLFILLPVPYAMAAGIVPAALPFITGLVAFSLISSAVYAFNDVVRIEIEFTPISERGRSLRGKSTLVWPS